MNTNPFGQPLDAALIADVLTSATQAKKQLDNALTAHEKTPGPLGVLTRSAHTALRTLAHADSGIPTGADADEDLADLIYALLSDYTAALENLKALAASPADPTVEYERLLREAEDHAKRQSSSPERAEALAKIADRWLSEALVNAHKRRPGAGGNVTHFGSPAEQVPVATRGPAPTTADIDRAYEAAKATCPEWHISEHIAFEAGWTARENWS